MTMEKLLLYFLLLNSFLQNVLAQKTSPEYWHGVERTIRYQPEGNDFVINNGNRRFTRALYGTNTAFRVEAGDLPEFALYLPGMGGNIKFGLINNDSSKWLINATQIKAIYRPGSMLYEITDPMLGKGKLLLTILAMADAEGAVIKIHFENVSSETRLMWAYGGVTGKRFSRDGDMGPDPESVFYLKPEYCKDDHYKIIDDRFFLDYTNGKAAEITGTIPAGSSIKIVNAKFQSTALGLLNSTPDSLPAIAGSIKIINKKDIYFSFQKKDSGKAVNKELAFVFAEAEKARLKIASRIKVKTPDKYINTIGGAISIAADAIWEAPSFMHGAIGWRMRLNGWRGAYAADVLGWHDRARLHFRSYALSQMTTPDSGRVVADTALRLARQLEQLGTSVFSSGYISRNPNGDFRAHHYDMNLVFIDQLLWHFNWTGDTAFVKEMWPLLQRHLAWEKRNFDVDGDGLYDAYAAIWASDALQYSGGAVTHSSAYNYRANAMAAKLASVIGEDPTPYAKEATKILNAVNTVLWIKEKGSYAEFKDALGERSLHESAALWTIYHSIDSEVPDAFKAWQSLDYISRNIPHIPIRAKGLPDGYYTISTSNWMPYTWSLNNVALAELMHTSLAYWQGGQNEEAFRLWKSSLIESMYLGGSPGNFQQISTYDAVRGEAYRDFADPVGMASRSLIQGLFGILPDALNNKLQIVPGFPKSWNDASLSTPDIDIDFVRKNKTDVYTITQKFDKKLRLSLSVRANGNRVSSVLVNGKKASWKYSDSAIGAPVITIDAGMAASTKAEIRWIGDLDNKAKVYQWKEQENIKIAYQNTSIKKLYDPQQLFQGHVIKGNILTASVSKNVGYKTAFLQMQQGEAVYWQAINAKVLPAFEFTLSSLAEKNILPGSNELNVETKDGKFSKTFINWNISLDAKTIQEQIPLEKYFNDKVSNIFKNKYLSPRPAVPTLQLPVQGIGDWTHPLLTADIDDRGLRKAAANNSIQLPQGITFTTPSDTLLPNIAFTSQWDNFPKSISIPLSGTARHAYFLMAGSTNPMQSQLVNGKIIVQYTDGSSDSLLLKNPENWWPIEQDYYDDGYAFKTNEVKPVRIHLKTGKIISTFDDSIGPFNGKMIDGGAATVLDMPLKKEKALQSIVLQTLANDVVIGLMSLTLIR